VFVTGPLVKSAETYARPLYFRSVRGIAVAGAISRLGVPPQHFFPYLFRVGIPRHSFTRIAFCAFDYLQNMNLSM
jgi:hypothetical protein